MKKAIPIGIIFTFALLFYLPIFLHPALLTNKGNDLTQFFWPLIYFTKNQIMTNHQLPFWNNLFFSGTPLLPDPQAPIFYLPNLIFLLFNQIDAGFIISVFVHIFISGIGFYLLSKRGFKFSTKTSVFCSLLYMASPKLSGYIEAGHFGLITSWTWLPFAFLSTIVLAKNPSIKKSILLSTCLAGLFYTHILIFAITAVAITILFVYLNLSLRKSIPKNLIYFSLSGLLCFGLVAIAFLPQISWQSISTRSLLLTSPDVYPKWNGYKDFIKSIFSSVFVNPNFVRNLDTEKTIAIGLFTLFFSFFGFIKLKLKNKILISLALFFIALISLNNISPIYEFLIKQYWYILLRVSTRFWFLATIISIFLAGIGFEYLTKTRNKFLIHIIALVAVLELLLTSWTKITKPILVDTNTAPKEVYNYLSQDKSRFRVFCLNRCLSQKESAIYGLELADGYGTLQQTNYYIYSEQLSQSFYRNRYTLSIPPFEIFEFENLQPYSPSLAAYNIKYIISNHNLKDKNLKLVKQIDNYLIYENDINEPRANYPITFYSPNFIHIDTTSHKYKELVLSEVYNPDWQAFANGKNEIPITETSDKTRKVSVDPNTNYINFVYEPTSFKVGFIITSATIILIIFIFKKNAKN